MMILSRVINKKEKFDKIFSKYDGDRSGGLDYNETLNLLNDALKSQNQTVNKADLQNFITTIDTNHDGMIQKN
jgi:Ca2+-binding EF-hand superfamily protein